MNLCDAVEMVLGLARENIISYKDACENETMNDRTDQIYACDLLEDFASNHIGDDSEFANYKSTRSELLTWAMAADYVVSTPNPWLGIEYDSKPAPRNWDKVNAWLKEWDGSQAEALQSMLEEFSSRLESVERKVNGESNE